jgi:O-antigen/teichoic acid export membrane protein
MAWVIVTLSFNTVAVVVQRHLVLRVVPEIERRPSLVDFRLFGSVLRLSGSLSLLRLSRVLSDTLNPIILTAFLGPSAVTFYRPGATLVRMAGPFAKALREQLQPLTTEAHVSGQKLQLQQLLIVGTRFTILLAIPIYVVLFVFAQAIVDAWVGPALGPGAVTTARVLMMLAVVEMAICFGGSQFPVLLGVNAVGFVVKLQLVLAVLNLVISVLLVGYTALGILGVIAATVVFEVLCQPLLMNYTARVVGLSVRDYLCAAYARPFAVMIAVAAFAQVLQIILQPHSLIMLLVVAALTGGWWAGITWCLGLEPADRTRVRNLATAGWASVHALKGRKPVGEPTT